MLCGWEGNRRSGVIWPCVTDFVVYTTCGLKDAHRRLWYYVLWHLYLPTTWRMQIALQVYTRKKMV